MYRLRSIDLVFPYGLGDCYSKIFSQPWNYFLSPNKYAIVTHSNDMICLRLFSFQIKSEITTGRYTRRDGIIFIDMQ